MSYEAHATMIITCITTSVYVYAIVELVNICLAMCIIASKAIPPTDCLSLLFNVWFGFMTFLLVHSIRSIIFALFFPDTTKTPEAKPKSTMFLLDDAKTGIRLDTTLDISSIAAYLFMNALTAHGPPNPATAETPNPATAEPLTTEPQPATETPPKSPGTPDSERSQAETAGRDTETRPRHFKRPATTEEILRESETD